jgi:hypothetical protein
MSILETNKSAAETCSIQRAVRRLAKKIARDVFKRGDDGRWKCNRIAFKSGRWPDGERDTGGMIESAMADVIERSLAIHLVKVNPVQVGARFD